MKSAEGFVWPLPAQELIAGTFVLPPVQLSHQEPSPKSTPWDPVRICGGPGTGKTTLLVEAAVARLNSVTTQSMSGIDPESVLFITANRSAAATIRARIGAAMLTQEGRRTSREPLVRTVHSYAYAVLRLRAATVGNPQPRLITGAEQDIVIRELLAGDQEDDAKYWPENIRPALGTKGFAQELRDTMMRAIERGIGPEDLIELGRRHKRPAWVAVGKAYRQYEYASILRSSVGIETPELGSAALDAAELIGAALTTLLNDPELLATQRSRIRYLFVDDAQHLDPQAAELLKLIGTGTNLTVIAGDSDQHIFGFRGASTIFFDQLSGTENIREVLLTKNFRGRKELISLTNQLVSRIPGARRTSFAVPAKVSESKEISESDTEIFRVNVYGSAAKEAAAIADSLRRAHLFNKIPWHEMAIITRSVPASMAPLRRALHLAGVPITTSATEIPLDQQRSVNALLTVLRAVYQPLAVTEVEFLLTGPIGGADPTRLRRLRRGIRRVAQKSSVAEQDSIKKDSMEIIADLLKPSVDLTNYLAILTESEADPLVKVRKVIDSAAHAAAARGTVEEILWAAWQSTGLERLWTARALRAKASEDAPVGGSALGDQADRDLDAVVALFASAANFVDAEPAATIESFVNHILALNISTESRTFRSRSDAVTVLSAHAAAGREFAVVAVTGIQEGRWPSLRSRGSIVETSQLVDLLDGVDPQAIDTLSRSARALADERRLLLVACSRAREQLLVTAIDDGTGDLSPSRFVAELALFSRQISEGSHSNLASGENELAIFDDLKVTPAPRSTLSLASLVAELRSAVCTRDTPEAQKKSAAELLARLADAGVAGAHPQQWYGLVATSTEEPLWSPAVGPLKISPSVIDSLDSCSLRWILEKSGGRDGNQHSAVHGTLVHTLVQAVAGELPPAAVTAALQEVWENLDVGAPWFSRGELARTENMLTNFRRWLAHTRSELTEVAVEQALTVTLPGGLLETEREQVITPEITIVGRIDRLERDSQGRLVVIDIKTGKNAATAADTEVNPQLSTYQLALALGGFSGEMSAGNAAVTGGARLVYVNNENMKTGATERIQKGFTTEQVDLWLAQVRGLALKMVGPQFTATVNSGCSHCPVTSSCPAHVQGRTVLDGN